MKKVFALLLMTAVLVTAVTANAMTTVHALLQKVGDVNGDGHINNRDLAQLQRFLSNWDVTVVESNADINSDQRVNNRDLSELQRTLARGEKTVKSAVVTKYTSLGLPAETHYPKNRLARCAWDMTIYNGRLYVGCGDYTKNSGASPVLSCPLNDLGNWSVDTMIPDEQVGRFININGVLTIPGYDPLQVPEYGSYYECINGKWVQQEKLPFGWHNFDIAWFQGRMYAAIGADRGEYPIAYTEDGEEYHTMPLYKNGKQVNTANSAVVRSSNLYVLGDELYADFWYEDEAQSRAIFEMYQYNVDEDRFDYVADLKTAIHGGLFSPGTPPVWAKEAVGNKMFLTSGYLYYTTNFKKYTQIDIPNKALVCDMMEYDGRLYVLTSYEVEAGKNKVNVYSLSADQPSTLRTEVSFDYALMATSFTMDGDNFFIGMGNWYGSGSAGNGEILQFAR